MELGFYGVHVIMQGSGNLAADTAALQFSYFWDWPKGPRPWVLLTY